MNLDPVIPLLTAGGPWAFAVSLGSFVVMALLRGWLVPGRTVEREQAHLRQTAQDWKDAYMAEVVRGEVRDAQMNEVLQFVRRQPTGTGTP